MRPSLILTATILFVLACSGGEGPPAPDTTTTTITPVTQTSTTSGDQQKEIVRNHFKGWRVGATSVNEVVWLKEAAASTEWKATVYVAQAIFNPATKFHQGEHGNQKDLLHYVAYVIEPVPTKTEFRFRDQFAKPAKWNFMSNEPSWLLVPSVKKHDEGEAQRAQLLKADHLLCYAVRPTPPVTTPVSVIDQFTKSPAPTVTTLMPSHVCVPVWKRKDQSTIWEGVDYPDEYLAIYSYRTSSPERPYFPDRARPEDTSVWTTDQLRSAQRLNVMHSEWLAVPATKDKG
jgi:hypothetical protein